MAYTLTNLSTVRVTGRYLDLASGVPLGGSVVFEPLQTVRSVTGEVVLLPNQYEVRLDFSGRIVVDLPIGDDADFTPDFLYRVTEKVRTAAGTLATTNREPFLISLTAADVGSEFDLILAHDETVTDPGPEMAQYVLKSGGTMTGALTVPTVNVTGTLTAGAIVGTYTPSGNFSVPGNLGVTGTANTGALTASSANITGSTTLGGNITGDGLYYNATTKRLTQGVAVNGGGLNTVVTNGTNYGSFSAENTGAGTNNFPGYDSITSTTTGRAYQARVAGEAAARMVIQSDGTVLWGDGTNARDTNLFRSAADTLRTDDNLVVGGNLTVTGSISNSASTVPWRSNGPKWWGRVNVVENFQTGHGWVHDGGFSSVNLNSVLATAHHGAQMARVTTDAAGTTGSISVTGKPAVDLSGKTSHVRLWVSVPTSQNIGTLQLRAAGAGGLASGNHLTWNLLSSSVTALLQPASTAIGATQYYIDANSLTPVQLSLGDAVVTGSPTRNAITEWRIIAADRNQGAQHQLLFSGIEVASNGLAEFGNSGICVLTFDDSMSGQYSYVRQELGKRGWQGSIFPIIDQLGQTNRLTEAQLKTLNKEGHEIGVHAYSLTVHNSPGSSADTVAAWMSDAQLAANWISERGMTGTSYAYPNGVFGTPSSGGGGPYWQVMSKFYDIARTTSQNLQINPTPLMNQMKVHAVTVGGSLAPTIAQMVAGGGLIERAATENGLLCLTMHDVSTSATGVTNVNNTDFATLLDAIKNSGMAVATLGQVAESAAL